MSRRTLSELSIGNFKAFADIQTIAIKPITLIFGPNSAGKSSIIHSLAFAHEVEVRVDDHDYEPGVLDIHRTDIGGTAIDLGGFAQFVHRGNAENRVEWGASLDVPSCDSELRDQLGDSKRVAVNLSVGIERDNLGHIREGALPRVETWEYLIDNEELLRLSRRGDKTRSDFRIDRLALEADSVKRILRRVWENSDELTHVRAYTKQRFLDLVNSSMEVVQVRASGLFPLLTLDMDDINDCTADPAISEREKQHSGVLWLVRQFWWAFSGLISLIDGEIRGNLIDLKYLGPLRSLPPRGFSLGGHKDTDWLAGGGYAWDVVCKDEAVREAVNRWLSSDKLQSPYRLIVKELVSLEDLQAPLSRSWHAEPIDSLDIRSHLHARLSSAEFELADSSYIASELQKIEMTRLRILRDGLAMAVDPEERKSLIDHALGEIDELRVAADDYHLQRFGNSASFQAAPAEREDGFDDAAWFLKTLDHSEVRRERKLVLRDLRRKVDVSHRDVGIGISQVLPVLVAALGSSQKLIAMEQPEIHLHPALQAELGDVFIEAALGARQNTFILETHSEHLILRIMRRIRESHTMENTNLPSISSNDVSVLYVEPVGSRSIVRDIPLNELGELAKAWPGGFFEEALREQFGDA